MPSPGRVKLNVVDVSGRFVKALIETEYPAGRHTMVWVGDDELGNPVGPGIYFIRIEIADFRETTKVISIR